MSSVCGRPSISQQRTKFSYVWMKDSKGWWRERNDVTRTLSSRRFHCRILNISALLLDRSNLRTRSFSSSEVSLCGADVSSTHENSPLLVLRRADVDCWVEFADAWRSSSSEQIAKSVGGSGIWSRSPCETGRKSDGMLGYSTIHFFFLGDASRKLLYHAEISHQGTAKWHYLSFTIKALRKIYGIIAGAYVWDPGLCPGRLSCNRNTWYASFTIVLMVCFCTANVTPLQI